MKFNVVIPARFGSKRLTGKPLLNIGGRPMIEHVFRRAAESDAQNVVIATDDFKVKEVCEKFGASVVMTDARHQSGTDRIAEVARQLQYDDQDVVVNLQGDEPLMPAENINQVAALLNDTSAADIGTLCTPISSVEEFLNVNVTKVVVGQDGQALYFSRAPIPWNRDAADELIKQTEYKFAMRHIGIYAYRAGALQKMTAKPVADIEQLEKLEQLRALWMGLHVQVAEAIIKPDRGVDTKEDLEYVDRILSKQ
ncbi:MAG: 3-deoxy-manno-octulosonate cytidylyltransferase [Gammaproteobacteria bacterium]|nr:3-deoxy-manno-octulosonate cytidylyltransferase [Gammaproteobacteria bacterium]